MRLKTDYKKLLITTKKMLCAVREFFICYNGIFNPLKVEKFEFSDFKIIFRF